MRTRPDVPDEKLSSGEFHPLPEGVYDFHVKFAGAKKSSAGNDMLELVLTVWGHDGHERTVWDYLIDTDSMEWKTREFCQATRLDEVYRTGHLAPLDCQSASGRVMLKVQAPRTVNGKTYEARNVVKRYMVPEGKPGAHRAPLFNNEEAAVLVGKEDIPF